MAPVEPEDLETFGARVGPTVEAIFLDAGNTLIFPDYARISGWCRDAGHPCAVEELERAEYAARVSWDAFMTGQAPRPGRGFFGRLLEAAGMSEAEAERVLQRIAGAEGAGTLWLAVRPGTVDALQALRDLGLTLGVISNADGRVASFLEQVGLASFMSFILDSGKVGVEKPDPAIFRMALESARVAPGRAIHVGDLCSVDVAGARACGIEAVVMDPLGLYATCDAPHIRSLSDLAGLIARHRR